MDCGLDRLFTSWRSAQTNNARGCHRHHLAPCSICVTKRRCVLHPRLAPVVCSAYRTSGAATTLPAEVLPSTRTPGRTSPHLNSPPMHARRHQLDASPSASRSVRFNEALADVQRSTALSQKRADYLKHRILEFGKSDGGSVGGRWEREAMALIAKDLLTSLAMVTVTLLASGCPRSTSPIHSSRRRTISMP